MCVVLSARLCRDVKCAVSACHKIYVSRHSKRHQVSHAKRRQQQKHRITTTHPCLCAIRTAHPLLRASTTRIPVASRIPHDWHRTLNPGPCGLTQRSVALAWITPAYSLLRHSLPVCILVSKLSPVDTLLSVHLAF